MILKRIDFVIIVFILLSIVLILDNFYFGEGFFNLGDIHHETFIVALVFGTILLILFRRGRLL